jgi:hypothetical protein
VEEPLVVRRHQLAVLEEQAGRPEEEERVVERSRPLALALVDADREVDVQLGTDLREPVDGRSRNVDPAQPHPLEQIHHSLVVSRLRDRRARVEGEEALRQDDELGPLGRRLVDEADRLLEACVEVEHHRCRLHGRDANRGERRHVRSVTQARRAVKEHL